METLANRMQSIGVPTTPTVVYTDVRESGNRQTSLKAIYTQLFKENRDLDFFHVVTIDSQYLSGQISTRQTVQRLLCSEMYRDYILMTNSNYHFVTVCFERVLGRPALPEEIRTWSSLLATAGLNQFAEKLTSCTEYLDAFGEDTVPYLRSGKLFSSNQNTPALPASQSLKRYTGPGNVTQWDSTRFNAWGGPLPPANVRKVGAVLAVAGSIELVRIFITLVSEVLSTGSL